MVDIRASLAASSSADAEINPDSFLNDEAQLSPFIQGQRDMVRLADEVIKSAIVNQRFVLRLSLFTKMHKSGYGFLKLRAGVFRSVPVLISNSKLEPPSASDVVELLDEMCDYVNENLTFISTYHLCAYIMWRFLWIHPFVDGNGSIARLVSYIVMQIKTAPESISRIQMFKGISDNRQEYYDALSEADDLWSQGRLDVSRLEAFLRELMSEWPSK